MTDTSVYNARDSRYKSPYGAVAAGTPVHFTLRPRRAEGFSRGVLTARLEQAGNRVLECPMPWTDTDFDRDAFSCTLDTGDYVGLVCTPSVWRPSGAEYGSWDPISSLSTTGPTRCRAGLGTGCATRSSRTAFTAPASRTPPEPWVAAGPPGLVRGPAGRPSRPLSPGAGTVQPGLFWRDPGGNHRKAGLSGRSGGGDPLPVPHLRLRRKPPVQHRRLPNR